MEWRTASMCSSAPDRPCGPSTGWIADGSPAGRSRRAYPGSSSGDTDGWWYVWVEVSTQNPSAVQGEVDERVPAIGNTLEEYQSISFILEANLANGISNYQVLEE
jgi:hypothetical protein